MALPSRRELTAARPRREVYEYRVFIFLFFLSFLFKPPRETPAIIIYTRPPRAHTQLRYPYAHGIPLPLLYAQLSNLLHILAFYNNNCAKRLTSRLWYEIRRNINHRPPRTIFFIFFYFYTVANGPIYLPAALL